MSIRISRVALVEDDGVEHVQLRLELLSQKQCVRQRLLAVSEKSVG